MLLFLKVLGFLSAILGVLIGLPDKDERLRPLQIGVNELSWLPSLLGLAAALGGLVTTPRAWVTALLGGAGVLLSSRPFLQFHTVAADMASAMRAGLGQDYESQIPTAVRGRLADSTWSLANSTGGRERLSGGQVTHGVTYTDGLTLDIYQPSRAPIMGDRFPALIVIHGGGWRNGGAGGWFAAHNRYYASQGYTVFDIEYRLSGSATWPAQYDDVLGAIHWIQARADTYQIDPERIALMGRSAGAHLALMAAYCGGDDLHIGAVVSLYGAIELRWPNLEPDSAIHELLGGRFEDIPDRYEQATPLNYARDGLPPTLIVEGGMDTITPYQHGDRLVNQLSLTDTPFVLLRVPWSRHGFDAVMSGLGGQLVQYHLDRFLAWSLYRKRTL